MSIQIGSVRLADEDGPPSIPLSTALAMTVVELSDGSRLVATTGSVPGDMVLTGVLTQYVAGKSPLQQYEQLEQMQYAALPVRFSWTNGSQRGHDARRAWVTITALSGNIVRAGDIEYSITLTQELTGGLATSTTTRGVKALQAMADLKKTASASSGPTAAAIAKAHAVYQAAVQHAARDNADIVAPATDSTSADQSSGWTGTSGSSWPAPTPNPSH